jgi:3-methylcrotonyl-CoA carboxylase alpha subunit
MRTARALGIRTVAVYSEADRGALHVTIADAAIAIGPAPARESYLAIDTIIAAAKAAGADAIHPGYGFLSENAAFADACEAAGIVFIGPPASAIRAMGSKSAAKALMEKAKVPLVPGYHGEDQEPGHLARAAAKIGFPVLIKASAGGGGKGMKIVPDRDGFADALASAKREALAAFGDDRVLVERYLERPRHIEMQVFADRQGNTIHLYERDCSIQRRHQKVIEEAPAPGLSDKRRAAMGAAAVNAAKAVGYVGAGTVEFIVEGDDFYFMEMNTRLQVEHPVTEAITGLDLVAWQIRVAEGHALPLTQAEVTARGHAVEARLYAEDATRDFLPQAGTLAYASFPQGDGIRVDTGVRAGDTIGIHYDPMIAQVIAFGADRAEAIRKLSAALADTALVGLKTNRRFLKSITDHPAFMAADLDTGFIARHRDSLPAEDGAADADAVAIAAMAFMATDSAGARAGADRADPHSPWHGLNGWRLNGEGSERLLLDWGGGPQSVDIRHAGDAIEVEAGGTTVRAAGTVAPDGSFAAEVGGKRRHGRAVADGKRLTIFADGAQLAFTRQDPVVPDAKRAAGKGQVTAPMPGRVIMVSVAAGERVTKGRELVVVEAMKMEHALRAPVDGTVSRVSVGVGDLVSEGQDLVSIEAEGEKPDASS